jgi:ring-1,2-phenylacetyl-CoA epoxidase subunit PaaD
VSGNRPGRPGAGGRTTGGTAYEIAASVLDPELPMLTLADLGVLRRVEEHSPDEQCVDVHRADKHRADEHGTPDRAGSVTVVITPTYSGCPALAAMRDDLMRSLSAAGYPAVRVEVELSPPWSSDAISQRGRQALADAGISPPGSSGPAPSGPVPLTLIPRPRPVSCPRCGSAAVRLISEFGATPCQAMYRCDRCSEPFGHVKEI